MAHDPNMSNLTHRDNQAYIWIYNSKTPEPGSQWFVVRSAGWVFPTGLPADGRICCDNRQPQLETALRDPWVDELIQANIKDWVAFSAGTPKLPKLLISGTRILHGLPSGEADFIRVMEQELGL